MKPITKKAQESCHSALKQASLKPKDAKTVMDSVNVEMDYIANERPMAYETINRRANNSVKQNQYYHPPVEQRKRDLLDNTRNIASWYGIDTKKAYKNK